MPPRLAVFFLAYVRQGGWVRQGPGVGKIWGPARGVGAGGRRHACATTPSAPSPFLRGRIALGCSCDVCVDLTRAQAEASGRSQVLSPAGEEQAAHARQLSSLQRLAGCKAPLGVAPAGAECGSKPPPAEAHVGMQAGRATGKAAQGRGASKQGRRPPVAVLT